MTDKQIIIDGIDVSECEKINTCGNKIKCVILQDDVCEINPYCEGYNCYYKQLQREKQNSQETRDTAIKEFNRAEELNTLLKRKEQECEQEKTLKEMYFTYYKAKHSDIKGEFFKLKADYNRAIQKLMQIEEYCKDCNLKCDYTACAVLHIINEGEL